MGDDPKQLSIIKFQFGNVRQYANTHLLLAISQKIIGTLAGLSKTVK